MKKCSVAGCENKHHGRGYCKLHYKKYILADFYASKACCVEGCQRPVKNSTGGKYYCSMHYTRLRRNEPLESGRGKRAREYFSFATLLANSPNPLEFDIPNRESWSIVSKLYYGNKCMECGWDKGECDAHHKIPVSKGGKNTINNAVILCPNCHRLSHGRRRKRFSDESMSEFEKLINSLKGSSVPD